MGVSWPALPRWAFLLTAAIAFSGLIVLWVRRISFPFFVLERMPKVANAEREAIRDYSRKNYAEPLQHKAEHSEPTDHQDIDRKEYNEDIDPLSPAPEL